MMGGFGFGGMLFGGLLMLAFWVVVIVGAIWLVATLVRGNSFGSSLMNQRPVASDPTPIEILKARYAKGEITKEQFDEMRRNLGV